MADAGNPGDPDAHPTIPLLGGWELAAVLLASLVGLCFSFVILLLAFIVLHGGFPP